MLPRRASLDRKSFNLVWRRGHTTTVGAFLIRYFSSPPVSRARFGVVVPASVVKNSATRHLLKRRLHSIIEHSPIYQLPLWLIIVVKKDISRQLFSKLKPEIISILTSITK